MKLFAIHAPLGPIDLDGARAVRTGFSFGAMIFGPLWLLARGLWLALFGYAILVAVAAALVAYAGLRPAGAFALFALANLYIAFEGRAIALAGKPLVDFIYAHSRLQAEKLYLERALAAPFAPASHGPVRADDSVIGVFPEPRR